MIYALLIMFTGATFPHISWHATPEACQAAAFGAIVKAEPAPVANAACVGVRTSDLMTINRFGVLGE
jgi:hypothetical protein